jgi:hypothetical protein
MAWTVRQSRNNKKELIYLSFVSGAPIPLSVTCDCDVRTQLTSTMRCRLVLLQAPWLRTHHTSGACVIHTMTSQRWRFILWVNCMATLYTPTGRYQHFWGTQCVYWIATLCTVSTFLGHTVRLMDCNTVYSDGYVSKFLGHTVPNMLAPQCWQPPVTIHVIITQSKTEVFHHARFSPVWFHPVPPGCVHMRVWEAG